MKRQGSCKRNPYSFLHVDKAEIDLDPALSPYDDRVYEKAGENLNRFIREEVFIQDEEPALYIYELTMQEERSQAFVVCTSIDEYEDDTIKT